MALITSRADLNQGASNVVASVVFAAGTTGDIRIHTSASNLLPALADGEFFEVRDHPDSVNNGLYQVETVTTSTDNYECDKVTPGTPIAATAETITTLGSTGASTEKSVHFDLANLKVYGIEQGNMDSAGVEGGAVYSFLMQEWKNDNYVIANAPFPMNAIDTDAGKYIMGQDSSGNSNGWNWADDVTHNTILIRTRKLLRNMGWDEVDANGITIAREFCMITLGTFEDSGTDTAFGQLGTDTTVDDTFDLDFAGPANEAIRFYEEQAQTDLAITSTTITRVGGSFITEGYKVGGQVTIRAAEDSANDGSWTLTAVTATVLTTSGLTVNADDTSARLSVDNDNAFRCGIRVRDGDTNGKTYGQSNLAGAGKTVLGNFVFSFPLANATDLKITATDATIATTSPYVATSDGNNTDGAVTAGSTTFTSTGITFAVGDVGKLITIGTGNNIGIYEIITFTDANNVDVDRNFGTTEASITFERRPDTGMQLTLYATGQSRGGLVGGPFNFSMILDGNNGTNIECFEWLQYKLRVNGNIDSGAGTNFGRTLELMARFNGDTAEFGSPDGGVNFPLNPETALDGGLFVDNLNAASDNATKFWDDTGALRSKPESIAITLDGNDIVTGDTASEYDLYFDRTIRVPATTLLDLVIGVAGGGQFTSAGGDLNNNSALGVGSYVRVSNLTGADEPMNGVYQITAETTPGSDWTVVRYDGQTIVAVTAAAANIDQHCVDSPDALIVHTNVNVATSADVSFTATDTITSAGSEFGVFAAGDRIEVEDSTAGLNDGYWEVLTASATTLTVSNERVTPAAITTQGTGPTVVITKLFSGDFDADVVQNFAFDDNVQGGRTVTTDTFVKAKAIGLLSAQYIPSPVSTISSGTPLTIPLFSATERNVT